MKFDLSKIQKDIKKSPMKLLIYGENGLGKSTFASESLNPIFIDLEGNIDHIETPKQYVDNWEDCLEFMRTLVTQEHGFKTLVIDSLESLEQKIWKYICKENNAKSIDDPKVFNFGKGYSHALGIWRSFLENLNYIRRKKDISILLIGHSGVRKHENFGGGSYDRYEPRIHAKASGLIADWCNCILFANKEVKIEENKLMRNTRNKKKVTGGNSIINTTCNASYVAKNIYNLPEQMELDWELFQGAVEEFYKKSGAVQEQKENKAQNLLKLFELKGFNEEKIEEILKEYGTYKEELEELSDEAIQDIIDSIKGE